MLALNGILNIIKDTGEKIPVHVWGDLTMEGTLTGEIGLDINKSESAGFVKQWRHMMKMLLSAKTVPRICFNIEAWLNAPAI